MLGSGSLSASGDEKKLIRSHSESTAREISDEYDLDEKDLPLLPLETATTTAGTPTCSHPRHSCVVNTKHILYVAERTVKDWQRIVRKLGLQQHRIDAIEMDNPHSSEEPAYKGYLKWQQVFPEAATCCMLVDVLDAVGRWDLRRDFQKEFGIQESHPHRSSPVTSRVTRSILIDPLSRELSKSSPFLMTPDPRSSYKRGNHSDHEASDQRRRTTLSQEKIDKIDKHLADSEKLLADSGIDLSTYLSLYYKNPSIDRSSDMSSYGYSASVSVKVSWKRWERTHSQQELRTLQESTSEPANCFSVSLPQLNQSSLENTPENTPHKDQPSPENTPHKDQTSPENTPHKDQPSPENTPHKDQPSPENTPHKDFQEIDNNSDTTSNVFQERDSVKQKKKKKKGIPIFKGILKGSLKSPKLQWNAGPK